MRRITIALVLVVLLAAFLVTPALAIVNPNVPICTGDAASGGAAGGDAGGSAASNSPKGPPFPAQGAANSGTNACP